MGLDLVTIQMQKTYLYTLWAYFSFSPLHSPLINQISQYSFINTSASCQARTILMTPFADEILESLNIKFMIGTYSPRVAVVGGVDEDVDGALITTMAAELPVGEVGGAKEGTFTTHRVAGEVAAVRLVVSGTEQAPPEGELVALSQCWMPL